MRTILIHVMGLLLFSLPQAAQAYCKCAGSGIEVWPNQKSGAVPVNTKVWIRLPALSQKLQFGKYPDFSKHPSLWASTFTLKQMAVGLSVDGMGIPSLRVNHVTGQRRLLQLRPQAPLQPNKTYKVVLAVGAWKSVIASFQTGTDSDAIKPGPPGIRSARYIWHPKNRDECFWPGPYAALYFDKKLSATEAPFIGIWLPDANGTINYKGFPAMVLSSQKKRLILGRINQCSEINFSFPDDATSITLGVRAGDLSSNWGPPQDVTIAYRSTAKPWTWTPSGRVFFWYGLGILIFLLGLLRTWVFQRNSAEMLEDFLLAQDAIKSDVAWLKLRKLVEKETIHKRLNVVIAVVQLLLFLFGLYVFFMSLLHFSDEPISRKHLILVAGPVFLFLLFNWLLHFFNNMRIKKKRHEIATLPIAASFQKPCEELLKGWRKKSAPKRQPG